jgi:hypothetical protein
MKFLLRSFLIIAFIILGYIFYRSEIYWDGKLRFFYNAYYLATLIFIFFIIILIYTNKQLQTYATIIFLSCVFVLYSFEFFLIFKKEQPNFSNNNFDKRTMADVYKDLTRNNNVAVRGAPIATMGAYKNKDYFSLAGISKIKTILCNEDGYWAIYQSDRYGFNNPDEQWDSNVVEYLLVGDSFTHGACVNRPNDIASMLRLYSKKNVLNLGQQGNGPLIEYVTLREYLSPNVKKVIWIFFEGNDLLDLRKELTFENLNQYLTDKNLKHNLRFKQAQIDASLKFIILNQMGVESDKYNLIKFIKLHNLRYLIPSPPPPPSSEFKTILKLTNDLVKNNNGVLYFVYLPDYKRYKLSNIIYDNSKNKVKKIINDLNIEFIDIDKEVFEKEKDPLMLFSLMRAHYNAEAYKKIASKIYEKTK